MPHHLLESLAFATEAEVALVAATTTTAILWRLLTRATRCAAAGCAHCLRDVDLASRALVWRMRGGVARDARSDLRLPAIAAKAARVHELLVAVTPPEAKEVAEETRDADPIATPPEFRSPAPTRKAHAAQRLGRIAGRTAAKPRAALPVRTSTDQRRDQSRDVPPYPLPKGGARQRRSRDLRRPTRAERNRAILTRERYRQITEDHNPCRHEPECGSEEECIGRLVEYARAELATGQAREARSRLDTTPIDEPVPQLLDKSFRRRVKGQT